MDRRDEAADAQVQVSEVARGATDRLAGGARGRLAGHRLPARPGHPGRDHHPLERLGSRARWQSTDDAYLQSDLTPSRRRSPAMCATCRSRTRAGADRSVDRRDRRRRLSRHRRPAHGQRRGRRSANRGAEGTAGTASANVRAARAVWPPRTRPLAQNRRDLARQAALFKTGSSSTEAAEKLQTREASCPRRSTRPARRRGRRATTGCPRRPNRDRRRPVAAQQASLAIAGSISATPGSWRHRTASSGNAR